MALEGERGAFGFGLGGLIVTGGVALGAFLVARSLGSFVAAGAAAHLIASLPAWFALTLLAYHRRQAEAERLETARLQALAAEGRDQLFGRQPEGAGDAARALARFERIGITVVALVAAALELGLAYGLTRLYPKSDPQGSLPSAAFLCGAAFALLLLGRYGFALERQGLSSTGAGGRRATSGALGALIAGLALAGQEQLGVSGLDRLGLLFVGVEALLGLETLLLVVLEAYRPRRPGTEVRPPYDSRLLGLLSAPADIARSIARSVDYQFGFGLSQTWFYRFLERWILPLVGFAVLSFWSLSALTLVHAHQAGLLFRLGSLQEQALEPGLHAHLPWPFDRVLLLPAQRLQALHTGHAADEEHMHPKGAREETLLWTQPHVAGEEELVLLARAERSKGGGEAPANLLAVSAVLHYRIQDPRTYYVDVQDPQVALEVLAEREVTRMLCSADLDELLRERGARAHELLERMRARVKEHGLGVEIVDAELTELHPPVEVGRAFERVTSASEEADAEILRAQADAAKLAPSSAQQADTIRLEAKVAAEGRLARARAGAHRFAVLRQLSQAAPGVFRHVRLLDELAEGASQARKIVLGRKSALTDLNLEDRVRAAEVPLSGLLGGEAGGDQQKQDGRHRDRDE